MELKDVLELLEKSSVFKNWQSLHKNDFLSHAFVMLDELNVDIWQVGFFDKKNSLMNTFFVENEEVKIIPDQEVLRSDAEILELDSKKVKVSSKDVMDSARHILKTEYKGQPVVKTFFILQQFKSVPVYNITFFTQAFKTVNIKISAVDGKILHHSQNALAEFG